MNVLCLLLLQFFFLISPTARGLSPLPASLDAARARGMLLKLSTPLAAPASYTPAVWVEDCDVWILGTVHLGSDSACEAEQLIEAVKPDVVVLEMAPSCLKGLELESV